MVGSQIDRGDDGCSRCLDDRKCIMPMHDGRTGGAGRLAGLTGENIEKFAQHLRWDHKIASCSTLDQPKCRGPSGYAIQSFGISQDIRIDGCLHGLSVIKFVATPATDFSRFLLAQPRQKASSSALAPSVSFGDGHDLRNGCAMSGDDVAASLANLSQNPRKLTIGLGGGNGFISHGTVVVIFTTLQLSVA